MEHPALSRIWQLTPPSIPVGREGPFAAAREGSRRRVSTLLDPLPPDLVPRRPRHPGHLPGTEGVLSEVRRAPFSEAEVYSPPSSLLLHPVLLPTRRSMEHRTRSYEAERIRSPAYLSSTTTCRTLAPVAERLSGRPRGFEGAFYAGSWMRTSENCPSPKVGE
jgi:hypothetical protein